MIDFFSLTSTSPIFLNTKWRPGWAQLLGIFNVYITQGIDSVANSERNVTQCIYRLTKSVELEDLMRDLCQSIDTIQYLGIVTLGLRDLFLCAIYIFTSFFYHKSIEPLENVHLQDIPLTRNRFVNT
ncbi:hypothetical protein BY458DRAFT_497356 [Sporodiniella umbellata]|nr:hypothetical protein BY458DRAFT_497356 [Sporodiniella umbellata]